MLSAVWAHKKWLKSISARGGGGGGGTLHPWTPDWGIAPGLHWGPVAPRPPAC